VTDPLKHYETIIRREHKFQIKRLKELHSQVHPDPDIVQSARAHFPEVLDHAVWVPWQVKYAEIPVGYLFFYMVGADLKEGDKSKMVRLAVVQYVEATILSVDAPEYQRKPVLRLAALIPFNPALIGELISTFKMFFDYSQSMKVKKEIYMQELRRKQAQAKTLAGKSSS